jgi:hypothetical protein
MKRKSEELLKLIPKEGLIKVTGISRASLTSESRTALIRKGNELFNQGKIDLAKRIFITTGYSDGLIRMGDYYFKKKKPLEAFRMYKLAPDHKTAEGMVEKMAAIIQRWLKADEKG